MKRLLDTDRSLGRNVRSANPEMANYAFYSSHMPPAVAYEVWFQEYEAFALLIGLKFLEHGFPQQTSVLTLRGVRPDLQQEHARILQLDPKDLF